MRLLRSLVLLAAAIPSSIADPPPADGGDGEVKKDKDAKPDTKYFHEAGQDYALGHYDVRYFTEKVPYEEHRPVLQLLIKSYLTVFDKIGVETWLAHGTLLGWWWNGRIMPWDYDVDVQVSTATMYWLGKNLNRTEHTYNYVDADGVTRNKTYMLDVNPHHIEVGRGDGQNVIDARWVDISNGMFIDITGLAERDVGNHPGVWSCKNFHKYRTTDLYPMRISEFEGVRATVPYSFERILIEEYGVKSLVTTEWEGHRWEPGQKEWVKLPEKKREEEEAKEKPATKR